MENIRVQVQTFLIDFQNLLDIVSIWPLFVVFISLKQRMRQKGSNLTL